MSPIYQYVCSKCGNTFEKIQNWGEDKAICPKCGGEGEKDLFPAPVPVHYKAAGFFTTEQRGLTGQKRKPNIRVADAD